MGPLSFRVSLPSFSKTKVSAVSFSPSFCRISHLPTSSFAAASRLSACPLLTGSKTAQATSSPRSVCMMSLPSSGNGRSLLHPPVLVHSAVLVIGVLQFQCIAVEFGLLGDLLQSPVLQLQLEYKAGLARELVVAGQDVISNRYGCLPVLGKLHFDLDVFLFAINLLGRLPLAD